MPRAQNAHAIVNAGFLYKLKAGVVEQSTLVYGNINEKFNHATLTEKYLVGKKLFDNGTLQGAYDILAKELQTDDVPPDPSPAFRRQLAIALFYKVTSQKIFNYYFLILNLIVLLEYFKCRSSWHSY